MKITKTIISVLLAAVMIGSVCIYAGAVEVSDAPSSADMDLAIVAGDYEEAGTDLEPEEALPSSYSSRDMGYTTAARQQINNTCWAYSSTSALETLLLKNGENISFLSPTHMNYWATRDKNENGWQREYTSAGYPYIPLGYYSSWSGAYTEEAFPASNSFSDFDRSVLPEAPHYGVTSIIYLSGSDRDTVKTAVKEYGAAVASFHYNSANMKNVINYYCDQKGLSTSQLFGHSIAIIGWDDEYDKENFRRETVIYPQDGSGEGSSEVHCPESNGAWLCKNSWGSYYGDQGCFWISYEDEYLFDKRFGPCFAVSGYQNVEESDRIYQNEIYGSTRNFDFVSQLRPRMEKTTYANVFNFSDYRTVLDKIVFETRSAGSAYTLYYIPVNSGFVPVSDRETWIELGTGVIGYEGYICADIDDIEIPDGRGAVAVEIEKTEDSDSISIGASEWIKSSGKYVFLPGSAKGQSFILGLESEAVDVMDFYQKYLSDSVGGTLVIKAITKESGIRYGDVDLDDIITILDATHIQKRLAMIEQFDEVQEKRADYDLDSVVSVLDATRIQKRLANLV